ncbi:MAG: alpha/beta fold hydrolase [Saprospiraceae bacterium]
MPTAIQNTEILQSDYPKYRPKPVKVPFSLRFIRFGFQTLGRLFPNQAGDLLFDKFRTPRIRARHKRSDEILEQAQVFEVLYGDRMLKGYEWGDGDRIALLIHGWESRGTALRSFVPDLLKKGFRVVAMDGPAHGDSEGTQTDLPDFGGAIIAMIRHLGEVEALICHSFGGASSSYALAELATDIKVKTMVYVGTPYSVEVPFENVSKAFNVPAGVAARFRKNLAKLVGRDISEFRIEKFRPNLPFKRVLVVHDRQDDDVPFSSGERIAKDWDIANLLVTDGYGHFVVMKNPDVIRRVTDFVEMG